VRCYLGDKQIGSERVGDFFRKARKEFEHFGAGLELEMKK
jgi:hypothetical protein